MCRKKSLRISGPVFTERVGNYKSRSFVSIPPNHLGDNKRKKDLATKLFSQRGLTHPRRVKRLHSSSSYKQVKREVYSFGGGEGRKIAYRKGSSVSSNSSEAAAEKGRGGGLEGYKHERENINEANIQGGVSPYLRANNDPTGRLSGGIGFPKWPWRFAMDSNSVNSGEKKRISLIERRGILFVI